MAYWRITRGTHETTDLLTSFALQPVARVVLAWAEAGVPISPDTLLHLQHAHGDEDGQRGPRVLGVDDLVLRKKQRRYGTLLLDLKRIGLLICSTTAQPRCLPTGCGHTGVEIIVQDRAGART